MTMTSFKTVLSPESPWLVMLHGFGGSRATWKKQVENFSDRFNILVVELPGHGDSPDGISAMQSVDLADIAAMVVGAMRAEGIEKAHFLALSLGTLVLACILQSNPEVVESVVLCGAVFGIGVLPKLVLRLGNTLKHVFPYMTIAGIMAGIMMPRRSHKVSRRFLMQECRKLGRAEFMRWYDMSIGEMDLLGKCSDLLKNVPSLIVMGREDHVFLSRAVAAVKELGGSAALEIIENCGHVCNIQRSRDFNTVAGDFLSQSAHISPTA